MACPLLEITSGNAFIGHNNQNCYGGTIDWRDIFRNTTGQRADIERLPKSCPPEHGELKCFMAGFPMALSLVVVHSISPTWIKRHN